MVAASDRDYLTVAEAARELKVSPSTVWRWIAADRLSAYRVGGRNIRIRKDDLNQVVHPTRPIEREQGRGEREALTIDEWRTRQPPSPEELARRHEVVQRMLKNRQHRSIAPLTSVDLVRQVREEREERVQSWLTSSS
jgi:excisionase family DNA binding protein